MTLAILLSVPGRVQFGVCCTGSTSEAEEEVDAFAVVVAGKHFETAAARSFMELVLRCVFKFFVLFGVLWGKFIAGLSGEASWRGLLEYSTTTTVTDNDLEEEEEAKFEDATDDIHDDESLGLLPIEEGANVFI